MKTTVSGGTETTSGIYTIHTFTSSGSLVVSGKSLNCDYLVVAGGGEGGGTRAHDAGGMIESPDQTIPIELTQFKLVVVVMELELILVHWKHLYWIYCNCKWWCLWWWSRKPENFGGSGGGGSDGAGDVNSGGNDGGNSQSDRGGSGGGGKGGAGRNCWSREGDGAGGGGGAAGLSIIVDQQ